MYAKFLKRLIDIILSLVALVVLLPVMIILAVVGAFAMKGNPLFIQPRVGRDGKIFNLLKFRSMTRDKDERGEYLPDEVRLTRYGLRLRSTSLDELPQLINILFGDMSIVGPRPLSVMDVAFMSEEQKRRHTVRPGLTGLAQANGRNSIGWEQKLEYDLRYIDGGITFPGDVRIILKTAVQVLNGKDTIRKGTACGLDLGDWLLSKGEIDGDEYARKQAEAREILKARRPSQRCLN